MCAVNIATIGGISLLVFIEIGISDDVDIVLGETQIPQGVYLVLTAVFLITSFIWLMSEWFLRRWLKYKMRYNMGSFYSAMIITTYVLLIIQVASGRALSDFLTMIPLFYLPYGFIYIIWSFVGAPRIRKAIEKRWEKWIQRGIQK